MSKFKPGDRVTRVGTPGPAGVVKRVRVESMRESIKEDGAEAPAETVTVLWDNGTVSHFIPDGLQKVAT